MFALFHDHIFRAELVQLGQGGDHVLVAGQLPRLAVVEHEHIDALEQAQQVVHRDVHPQIHRVGDDELRLVELLDDRLLSAGRVVGQQDVLRLAMGGRQHRRVALHHAQFRAERAPVVHVHLVLAGPVERLALANLQPPEVHLMALEQRNIFPGEIGANHADQLRCGEKTGRNSSVAARAAEEAGVLFFRRDDRVQRGGSKDKQAHFLNWVERGNAPLTGGGE